MKLLIVIVMMHLPIVFGADLDELGTRPDLFAISKDTFEKTYAVDTTWVWTSKEQSGARAVDNLTFLKIPVAEALITFDKDLVKTVVFSIYTRGDSKTVTKDVFDKLLKASVKTLTDAAGTRALRLRPGSRRTNVRHVWKCGTLVYVLSSGVSKKTHRGEKVGISEYLYLTIYPVEKGRVLSTYGTLKRGVRKGSLLDQVTKSSNGDVFIEGIPMVDQGTKGYCACAATTRVLQYYGRNVDQRKIAWIANVSPETGVSVQGLLDGLKRIKSRLNIKIDTVWVMNTKEFKRKMRDYNYHAKRDKKPQIEVAKGVVDISTTLATLDPDVMIKSFAKKSASEFFMKYIKRNILKGTPLNWSVILGIFPETYLPQNAGGHMRLIIGYNVKTKEIIYTDSWGSGHDFKRIRLDYAVAMTTGIFVIKGY